MIKVGIVGGSGYVGGELLRLLLDHADVNIIEVTSRVEAGSLVQQVFPALRMKTLLSFSQYDQKKLSQCDIVFFATPDGVAMKEVPYLLDKGVRVIDLSADFRLSTSTLWEQWYGMKHLAPWLIKEAVYGLPEIYRDQIAEAILIANPGCYPTATQLGLLPLVEAGLVQDVIVDAKSGVSGAGRAARLPTLLCEASESCRAYHVSGHRHLPEIRERLVAIATKSHQKPISGVTFVPHIVPMLRGIHATIYCNQIENTVDLQNLFEARFVSSIFVDIMPQGVYPETRSVRSSNICRISVERSLETNKVIVLSVIDNLMKGAAGQAIQNMNIMCGFNEQMGLHHYGDIV